MRIVAGSSTSQEMLQAMQPVQFTFIGAFDETDKVRDHLELSGDARWTTVAHNDARIDIVGCHGNHCDIGGGHAGLSMRHSPR